MTSICIVGTDNFAVLNPAYKENYFGGEAVQQAILAKAFLQLGYDVKVVCLDYGQPAVSFIDGIEVIKTYRESAGLPIVKFFYPRLSSVYSALQYANADIYFQSCAGVSTGYTAYYCRKHSKQFIFRVASDTDCIPGEQLIQYSRDKKIYEFGLRRASVISAQSAYQQKLLAKHYDCDSELINMACALPAEGICTAKDIDVLWVSNIRQCKRPDLFLDIAEQLPQIEFSMIGGVMSGEEPLFESIQMRASKLSNVSFHGAVHYSDIDEHFASARVFLNTSDVEGFPNTFLQSWAHRIPVVSFFDPDDIIKNKSFGVCPENIEEMKLAVCTLLADDHERKILGCNGFDYVKNNYSAHAVAMRYQSLFKNLPSVE